MLQFNKLRLSGFKSFVDATELPIEPGLTGIVGPNGCGKSNLVEALRWVMGETSAKHVRGGEMDDVIFGGTADRPPRNVAEVLLGLDNVERAAPAQFNDFDELEIGRRIERGAGSTYRVNRKEVRARDVHLLFADSATGARSTALVSQGRVGTVIAAKPVERRALLEEAAGITGLHSRRHEAELRLRGAEANLERLDDVVLALEAQLLSLKKQARQANRYRSISDHIRRAEASVFFLRRRHALHALEDTRQRLGETERLVADLTRRAAAAATDQAEAAAGLPALRQTEAEAAAAAQRLVLARENLDAEEQRIAATRGECQTRLDQVDADIARESALAVDAEAAARRLEAEQTEIGEARRGEAAAERDARERLAATTADVDKVDSALSLRAERVAADEARSAALTRRLDELRNRARRLAARAAEIAEQRRALAAEAVETAQPEAAQHALEGARGEREEARTAAEAAEAARAATTDRAQRTTADLQSATTALARLEAEESGLAELLEDTESGPWSPLIDSVTVEPGYEAALAAALGEDLSAPADEAAPVHWRTLAPPEGAPFLPDGAEPLARFVKGPAALNRRLHQIGVVSGAEEGGRAEERLAQGQRLVSPDGDLWRWDGFTVTAGAPTAAAARLTKRNRLAEVRARIARAAEVVAAAETVAAAARAAHGNAAEAERTARVAARGADDAFSQAREALADRMEKAARHTSRLAALKDAADGISADHAEAEAQATETAEALDALADLDAARSDVTRGRAELGRLRGLLRQRDSDLDTLLREAENRRHRLGDIAREIESWQERRDGAKGRMEQLEERHRAVATEMDRLAGLPREIADRRRTLLSAIETADDKRKRAADRLAAAEKRLAEADKRLRAAETELARAREEGVRAEGTVEQADQALRSIKERAAERLQCAPDDLGEIAGLTGDAALPELAAVERRVERLHRERDTMGPVNLRAETEADELKEQTETMQAERGDLVRAIEKLRQGIRELNHEGRGRLLSSFSDVDLHFRELFVRLFGGGRAYLELTESDDPLEAGLEIMASPPGKRLQILSLLSGGEQALTALALLFAVFLTNPAPVCVMDEVDAPLDDPNVDRFCSLVQEIAHSGRTRFLIVTHHRMTMARMDRLFGVTMSERGVSELVSVDLRQAEALKATA